MTTQFFNHLDSDPMADLIASPSRTPVRAASFTERCTKCNGSGNFVSYSGRIVGPCFTCKGEGSKTFKNSAEDRARAAVKTATRKANTQDQNLEDFKLAHPDLWQWMDGNSFGFAVSMIEAVRKYGNLTENQEAAVRKCIASDASRAIAKAQAQIAKVEMAAAAPSIDTSKIWAAFEHARNFKNQTKEGTVAKVGKVLMLAEGLRISPSTRNPETTLVVKENTGDRRYLGKIVNNKFFAEAICEPVHVTKLQTVATDPEAATRTHSELHSECGVCGRGLTNHKSINRGIGPICAQKFGWG